MHLFYFTNQDDTRTKKPLFFDFAMRQLVIWLLVQLPLLTAHATESLKCSLARKDRFGSVGLIKMPAGFCSGTLISPTVVLTAGHCVLNTRKEELHFTLKWPVSPSSTPQFADVAEYIIHPTYWKSPNGSGDGVDIALIRLSSKNYGGDPIFYLPLATSASLGFGYGATSVGYGVSDDGGPEKKRQKPMTFLSMKPALGKDGRKVPNAKLTFKRGETGELSCSGDSGGPVVIEREGQLAIVGVNSQIRAAVVARSAASAARKLSNLDFACKAAKTLDAASVSSVLDWIVNEQKKLETETPSVICP